MHAIKSKNVTTLEDGKTQEKIVYQNMYSLMEYESAGANKSNWKANLDMSMAQCLTKEV